MYRVIYAPKFLRKSAKLTKKNLAMKRAITEAVTLLTENPFHASLKTHKVFDVNGKPALSSCVTDDIRILWDFVEHEIRVLELYDIGGHSGKNKVYR